MKKSADAQTEESNDQDNKMWREILMKSAEDRKDEYTMGWRNVSKKSANGRTDDDSGVSFSTPLTMEQRELSNLTE